MYKDGYIYVGWQMIILIISYYHDSLYMISLTVLSRKKKTLAGKRDTTIYFLMQAQISVPIT